jgi:hypothetical protein
MELSTKELADFEFNGSQYLYNLDPATGNLFFLDSISISKNSSAGNESEEADSANKLSEILRYRVKSVKLDNTIGLEFDNSKMILPGNPICLTGIKESHNFTIEWVEDSFFRIQKFHKSWIDKWFQNKVLIDGTDGKFVTFKFKVFYLYNSGSLSPNLTPRLAYTLSLTDCVPLDLSDFSFSYDDQDSGKIFIGKYAAKKIEIIDGESSNDNRDKALVFDT